MGKRVLAVLLGCMFVAVFALAGCSSSGSGEDAKQAFVGTWDIASMSDDGEDVGGEDLELMKALGIDFYLTLDEDGTAELMLVDPLEGTWEATGPTSGKMTLDGVEGTLALSGSELKFEQGSTSITFERGESHETSSLSAASSSASADSGSSGSSSAS